MRAIQVGDKAVSILFSQEAAPDRRQMLRLVRQALESEGIDPWPETEVECFAAGEDAMVIARPGAARRCGFYFDDLESLLAGLSCCRLGGGERLYLLDGGYLLTLRREAVCPGLHEFGREAELSLLWEAHAREQGLCLAENGGVSDLRRHFSS